VGVICPGQKASGDEATPVSYAASATRRSELAGKYPKTVDARLRCQIIAILGWYPASRRRLTERRAPDRNKGMAKWGRQPEQTDGFYFTEKSRCRFAADALRRNQELN
jgi:hypothetical protein